LIEFGRFAVHNRARRGRGKPETFNFQGFTLICGKSMRGKFLLKRKTRSDRLRARLRSRRSYSGDAISYFRTREMAAAGRKGIFRLPRSTDEFRGARDISFSCHDALVAYAQRAQPNRQDDLGANEANCPANGCPNRESFTRGHPIGLPSTKVGAVCGKAARTVLCGGAQ